MRKTQHDQESESVDGGVRCGELVESYSDAWLFPVVLLLMVSGRFKAKSWGGSHAPNQGRTLCVFLTDLRPVLRVPAVIVSRRIWLVSISGT
jgi:hypothetical protein